MNIGTFAELVPLIAVPVWVIVYALEQLRIELKRFNDREDVTNSERQQRQVRAKEALTDAVRHLSTPDYDAMDYTLGTGHGSRRYQRIVAAKTFDEISRIISGEDVATELDNMAFREAVEVRENNSSLVASVPRIEV